MMLAPKVQHSDGLDHLVRVTKACGDGLRAGILQALASESFGVLELGRIFDMAQPAMSHHLRILSDAGLVTRRKEGTSIFYQRTSALDQPLLETLFREIDAAILPKNISKTISQVHKTRQRHTLDYFAHRKDALAKQRELICTPAVYTDAVMAAAALEASTPALNQALEVGPGGGDLLTRLSPMFNQVLAIDNSAEMLDQVRDVALQLPNVVLDQQDFQQLSTQSKFERILATMVVHHQASPAQFFHQAKRLLNPTGILVIAELCPHNHEWVKTLCGDIWLGFGVTQLHAWASSAGLKPCHQEFLAQRNGFTVQVLAFEHTEHQRTED